MRRDRKDPACLWDMLEAARHVTQFVAGRTFDEYTRDVFLRSAVERQVEIIGEAARGVSEAFRQAHPELPWIPITAQRHILAHEYDDLQHDLIWRVATMHVPALIGLLEPLVIPPEQHPEGEPPHEKET